MSEFEYKKYTEQEEKIYAYAMAKLQKAVSEEGMSYDMACSHLNIEDASLKAFIANDFLKVLIAQLHYEKGLTLKETAEKLGVSHKKIIQTNEAMVEEISAAAVSEFHKQTSAGQA